MRVLHIAPSFYPAHGYGGPIASLYQLTLAQVAAGAEVRVLTSDADGQGGRVPGVAGRWVNDFGVPTRYASTLTAPGPSRRLFKASEDLSLHLMAHLPWWTRWADVIHVTAVFSPTSLLGISAGGLARRPLVLSPRGSLLPWALQQGSAKKRLALRALNPLLRRVAGWHATSQEEAGALAPLGCCGTTAQVQVIENGVTLPALPSPRPARGPGPIITLLGRIDPVKGLDLAVATLPCLRRQHPQATLVLAGPDRDGYGAVLRRQAEALGVADALRFTGLVTGDEKTQLLAQSDALWLCSRMESFGNVVLEALAVGAPVIAVHTTPWSWLASEDLGAHCPATPEAVAAATDIWLRRLAAPAARAAFASRARQAVAQRFAWPAIARRMLAFYQQII